MKNGQPIVVCGAGAAGLAAAVSSARQGRPVVLLDRSTRLGGTVTHVLIHTIGGLFDSSGEYLNGGLARELAETLMSERLPAYRRRIGRTWILAVCPSVYEAAINRWVDAETRIQVLTGSRLIAVQAAGRRITHLRIASASGETMDLRPYAVIDATGTAEVARLTRDATRALARSRAGSAAGGLIFKLRGVAPDALTFPKGLGLVRAIHAAAKSGELHPLCANAWLDHGILDDEVYAKLLVPINVGDGTTYDVATMRARQAQQALVHFLRSYDDFAAARIDATGSLGIRDGGAVVGQYELTADDVRSLTKFPDAACRCAWPIEFWDPHLGVELEYLAGGGYYEIPLRSLRSRDIDNLWAAGKCLSADAKAQASARVAGTCLAMGEAVGVAAANS